MGVHALDRILFHLETPDAGGGGAATAVAEAPPPAAEPAEPPADAAVEPAPETFALTRADWERHQQIVEQLAQRVYAEPREPYADYADPRAGETPREFVLDPLDDSFGQNLASFLDERIARAVEQATMPFYEERHMRGLEEGGQLARDILSDIASRPGASEFDATVAQHLATSLLPSVAGKWGYVTDERGRTIARPEAAEEALEMAAKLLMDNNRKVAEQAVNRYIAESEQIGTAARGLPATGAAGVVATPEARDEIELGRAIASRMRV